MEVVFVQNQLLLLEEKDSLLTVIPRGGETVPVPTLIANDIFLLDLELDKPQQTHLSSTDSERGKLRF